MFGTLGGAVVASTTATTTARGFRADIVIRDTLRLGVRDGLVVPIALRVARDDVPGVQKAWKVSQHA